MWLNVTHLDSKKPTMRWCPHPPMPPPCKVDYRGLFEAFIGPEDEFFRWCSEPRWRRILGMTAWDRNQRTWRP